jgi:hypothetical protein
MRKSLHILCLPLLFALFAIGCSGSSEGGGDTDYNFDTGGLPPADTSTTVDAAGSADTATAPDTIAPCDIAALFERNGCSTSGCHGDAYRSTPPLVGNDFESRLVGQRSLRPDCHANIIDPAAPEESLILRLTDPARYDAANDCGAPMPPYGAAMSPDDVSCLEGWVRQVAAAAAEGSAEGSAATFEPQPLESAVAKAKALLHGGSLTDADLATARSGPDGLRTLVDGWVRDDAFEVAAKDLFAVALRTQLQGSVLDILDGSQRFLSGKLDAAIAASPAETAWGVVARNEPLPNLATTRKFVVSTAELVILAWFETLAAERQLSHTVVLSGATPPSDAQAAADRSWTFAPPSGRTCVINTTPSGGGYRVSSTALLPMLFGRIPCRDANSYNLAAPVIRPEDYTDFRTVQLVPGQAVTPFYDLAALRSAQTIGVRVPRVGFFSTLAFRINWRTNVDNDFRVTTHQALIGALGAGLAAGDATEATSDAGLDAAHTSASTDCYACHRLIDPMRLYFSTAMTTAQFPRESGPSLQPSFAFLGVQSEAAGLDGFAETLAEHPRFATAWTQHVCAWANGTACDEGDPEFQRIATVFRERGYQFRTLVAEVMSSPLTTGLAPTQQDEERPFGIAIARQQTFCHLLEQRLATDVCASSGVKAALGLIPADSFIRGAAAPLITVDPNLFQFAAAEAFCRTVATLNAIVSTSSAALFPADDSALTLSRIVEKLMGLPPSHPRHRAAVAALFGHYAAARDAGATALTALQSAFVMGCVSPDVLGVGL